MNIQALHVKMALYQEFSTGENKGQKNRNLWSLPCGKTGSKKQYYIYGKLRACVYPHMWGLRVRPTHGVIHTLSQNSKGEKRKDVQKCHITESVHSVMLNSPLENGVTARTKKPPPMRLTSKAVRWKVNRQTHIPPPILTNDQEEIKHENDS